MPLVQLMQKKLEIQREEMRLEHEQWREIKCNREIYRQQMEVLINQLPAPGDAALSCTSSKHPQLYSIPPYVRTEEGITSAEGNQKVSTPISRRNVPTVWKEGSFFEGLLVHQL